MPQRGVASKKGGKSSEGEAAAAILSAAPEGERRRRQKAATGQKSGDKMGESPLLRASTAAGDRCPHVPRLLQAVWGGGSHPTPRPVAFPGTLSHFLNLSPLPNLSPALILSPLPGLGLWPSRFCRSRPVPSPLSPQGCGGERRRPRLIFFFIF